MYLLLEHFHLFAHSALVVLQPIFFIKARKKRNKLKIVLGHKDPVLPWDYCHTE